MEESLPTVEPSAPADDRTRVLWMVLLSGVFLAVQVSITDYGPGAADTAVFWFAVGVVLLWFVHRRRSRVAHGFIVITSLFGTGIYTLGLLTGADGPSHQGLLALANLGQALPLMTGPVHRHITSRRAPSHHTGRTLSGSAGGRRRGPST